ncbi:MAG: LPXTG cell wall anchor domain-containing protein [bacterium]|nr:LPXTG cell wall anchor domain-containing protein [bacterium]
MTKTKLIFIGLALALVGFLFAGSASAQDQTLTADPSAVSEPGTYDITINGSGYTPDSGRNLAVCSTGDPSEMDGAAGLMQYCGGFGDPVTIGSDGTYSTTIEGVEITDAGVTILLFELVQDGEAGVVSINIGEPMDDMIPATGVNTSLLVIIGAGVALAGVMVFGLSRRLRTL